ncbi:hypothetical protein PF005_g21830 [Phytophthora fragariae]|uniref:Uncharacterized protein n=1 Tax=Phytophthora fragariae TaxID=53985 RepID=A0A6A4CFL2_9STRA|nr:hypothetical protein PF005_g21830 [Phytophthora fragariae]KAE9289614.1 hypothetical protein PF001_g19955 [Phytophthora fragariae]
MSQGITPRRRARAARRVPQTRKTMVLFLQLPAVCGARLWRNYPTQTTPAWVNQRCVPGSATLTPPSIPTTTHDLEIPPLRRRLDAASNCFCNHNHFLLG